MLPDVDIKSISLINIQIKFLVISKLERFGNKLFWKRFH